MCVYLLGRRWMQRDVSATGFGDAWASGGAGWTASVGHAVVGMFVAAAWNTHMGWLRGGR